MIFVLLIFGTETILRFCLSAIQPFVLVHCVKIWVRYFKNQYFTLSALSIIYGIPSRPRFGSTWVPGVSLGRWSRICGQIWKMKNSESNPTRKKYSDWDRKKSHPKVFWVAGNKSNVICPKFAMSNSGGGRRRSSNRMTIFCSWTRDERERSTHNPLVCFFNWSIYTGFNFETKVFDNAVQQCGLGGI